MHPTVKPVAMVADAIKDCSQRRGIVLDPFSGSGTTLIAAHKTGRRARVMELDPLYVDVAVRRWQAATGLEARLAFVDKIFEEIELERAAEAPASNRAMDNLVAPTDTRIQDREVRRAA